MKILITGMNSAQCIENFWKRQDLEVVNTQYALVQALRDMGHEVHHTHAVIGESMDHYDRVIAFIHNPAGFSRYLYNGLWAISQRPDCVLAIDDWQADSIWDGITGLEKETMFRPYLRDMQEVMPPDVEKYADKLYEAVEIIKAKKNRMLIAGFQGGDISLMLPEYPKHLFRTWLLNPYHLNRRPENNFTGDDTAVFLDDMTIAPKDKKKEWVFTSLMQGKTRKYLESLNLGEGWKVNIYGGLRGQYKTPRLIESDMCNCYQQHWGVLVPKYYHAGSGFWRPRVFQVADANSILVCDDAEGRLYSEAHVGLKPADIEEMNLKELIDLAKRQKEGLYSSQPLDKMITRRQLDEVLSET